MVLAVSGHDRVGALAFPTDLPPQLQEGLIHAFLVLSQTLLLRAEIPPLHLLHRRKQVGRIATGWEVCQNKSGDPSQVRMWGKEARPDITGNSSEQALVCRLSTVGADSVEIRRCAGRDRGQKRIAL